MTRRPTPLVIALIVAFALIVAACGSSDTDPAATGERQATPTPAPTAEPEPAEEPAEDVEATDPEPEPEPAPSFVVRTSVNQLHILDAEPGLAVAITGPDGTAVEGTVDELGSLLFRDIPAGDYDIQLGEASSSTTVADVSDPHPDPSFYSDQEIGEGFGYVTTRDGTTLSINVVLPGGDGPYPTLVEYSGYGPSNPGDSTFAQLYTTLGYAYVGVNMRGTGCSGGSFEFFEPIQLLDGYDMIEAIAAQPWVMHNEVGMVGVSYPGISQLFVASTQPPSLAAITPLSVLDDATASTLYPGGILNTGFALSWSDERESDSAPYGQGWEQGIVDGGDTECEANQLVRLQNTDARALIEDNPFYVPELADPIAPDLLVDQINVPVFLAGAWQDEQTGGHFPAMLDRFTNSPKLFATMMNGSHTESIANPAIFERMVEFIELYVAKRTPQMGAAALVGPIITNALTGSTATWPASNRFDGLTYEEALVALESDRSIRILFEDGLGEEGVPGAPVSRYEASFDTWPIPEGENTTWYLTPEGGLSTAPVATGPDDTALSSYTPDPDNVPPVIYEGGSAGIWAADVEYDWEPIPAGSGADWISAPLDADTVIIGSGSLDLWLRSTGEDADLEVTISEVRPDGQEVYVQSGWLRASQRALDEDASLPNRPVHTHVEADQSPLSASDFVEARVEIFPFAHAFRSGSRIRITVDAPGGARPLWAFAETLPGGQPVEIAHDSQYESKLVLRVVPGIDVPAEPPACGALRSQPCREYVPLR